jgi:hypothetical protein
MVYPQLAVRLRPYKWPVGTLRPLTFRTLWSMRTTSRQQPQERFDHGRRQQPQGHITSLYIYICIYSMAQMYMYVYIYTYVAEPTAFLNHTVAYIQLLLFLSDHICVVMVIYIYTCIYIYICCISVYIKKHGHLTNISPTLPKSFLNNIK